ncbi:3-isopropylmalate dehydratase small subunit [Pedomonas sp. V897]|uniref:3-isopropylmalate dehydratase small subunit n=1 Tax=Pedomonas sp. V897 TaxID=3446482 RepID=UPI003EE18B53
MQAFKLLTGTAIPFGQRNVDTDVIIPARHLKSITRSGLGKWAFETIRYNEDGSENPDAIFNQERYRGAPILIAGDNFGCGSSREHAAWALGDLGIRAIIAPSYSDIFSGNAFKNGILAVVLPQAAVDRLLEVAKEAEITIDLENQVVTTPFQDRFAFEIDPFRKHCLLNGLDEIGITLQMEDRISAYEANQKATKPWLAGAAGLGR